ncbi:Scr1 family TA system antitoxin-like transcriptional regulator [Streptomyces sp. KLOTTS4A1]|uniref:Scr1 family TA system antitoxin-like transcriptional regulator n=1 Tax=Streptomyces sp. KLOTTS4A1 TaxID=3390996 RepID=UPI0039F459E9
MRSAAATASRYLGGEAPALDTVELDSTHGAEFIDADMQLQKYRAQLDAMESVALKADASRDFIRAIADEL